MNAQISKSENCVPCHKYTYYATFYSFHECKKPTAIFFQECHVARNYMKLKRAQIESFRAADKSYTFISNHLHRSKGCIQDYIQD